MIRVIGVVLFVSTMYIPKARSVSNRQNMLAQIIVSESGFQLHKSIEEYSKDPLAIAEVLRTRSRDGHVTTRIMRLYSSKVFDTSRIDNRKWLPYLTVSNETPLGWYEDVPWYPRYAQRYEEIYQLAGRILRRDVRAECRPHHWGAPYFVENAQREGWEECDCGNTLNTFWRVPGRD